jgi:hypothetical protein
MMKRIILGLALCFCNGYGSYRDGIEDAAPWQGDLITFVTNYKTINDGEKEELVRKIKHGAECNGILGQPHTFVNILAAIQMACMMFQSKKITDENYEEISQVIKDVVMCLKRVIRQTASRGADSQYELGKCDHAASILRAELSFPKEDLFEMLQSVSDIVSFITQIGNGAYPAISHYFYENGLCLGSSPDEASAEDVQKVETFFATKLGILRRLYGKLHEITK